MKVLFASRRPVFPLFQGGAELSFYELAKALAEAGHHVAMIGECSHSLEKIDNFFALVAAECRRWEVETTSVVGRPVPRKYRLLLRLGERFEVVHTFLPDFKVLIEETVETFAPDVVCTQLEGSPEVVDSCVARGIRSLHFVRDTYNPANFHVLGEHAFSGQKPSVCVANSNYTASFLKRKLGLEAEVLYPIVSLREPPERVVPAGRRVLFSNPVPLKGGDLMFEVARELTEVSFVVLPGWGIEVPARWRALDNVEIRPWPVLDMAAAFASVRLVVLPSQYDEGFGRVGIEAQRCGAVVMASRHSGLAEVLGETAILVREFADPAVWMREIRRVFTRPKNLEALARAGRKNAARFLPDPICKRFEHINGVGTEAVSGVPEP